MWVLSTDNFCEINPLRQLSSSCFGRLAARSPSCPQLVQISAARDCARVSEAADVRQQLPVFQRTPWNGSTLSKEFALVVTTRKGEAGNINTLPCRRYAGCMSCASFTLSSSSHGHPLSLSTSLVLHHTPGGTL